MALKTLRVCVAEAAVLIWWICLSSSAEALSGPGVIRSVLLKPPGCKLDPPDFSPDGQFYVVECPQAAAMTSLILESSYDLEGSDGKALPRPFQVRLSEGEARLVTVSACGRENGERLCTTYEFDVHRGGSSQAALTELLISSGSLDADLLPPFDPAVTDYEARVPNAAETTVVAEASRGGFVSFDAFSSAERGRAESYLTMISQDGSRTVAIYVVSADRRGQTRYQVILHQMPSTDAGLGAIRSNVGRVSKLGDEGSDEYMLTVPPGSREVAISATARDKDGATVKVHDTSGLGYASSVISLQDDSPYELVHINVHAADRATTAEYILVVIRQSMASIAMLSALVVKGCVKGLQPAFRVSVNSYHCVLDQQAEDLEVKPTTMWMPAGQGHMSLSVQGKDWQSGLRWNERLDDLGNARLTLQVSSADGNSHAEYTVMADGYPSAMRGPLFSTPYPTLRATTTGQPAIPLTSTAPTSGASTSISPIPSTPSPAPGLRPAGGTDVGGTVVSTTTWFPSFQPGVTLTFYTTTYTPPHPTSTNTGTSTTSSPHVTETTTTKEPLWDVVQQHIPKLSERSVDRGIRAFDVAIVSSCVVALLSSPTLASGLSLLKQLQFIALTMGLVAPRTLYAHLAVAFGAFNLWARIPIVHAVPRNGLGERAVRHEGSRLVKHTGRTGEEDEDVEKDEDKVETDIVGDRSSSRSGRPTRQGNIDRDLERHAGGAVLLATALPVMIFALLLGWYYASQEEDLARRNVLREVGRLAPRAKLLPCALVALDIGVLGFTQALGALLLGPPVELHVGSHVIGPKYQQLLLLMYPIGYSVFCFLQLCRLRREGRLVWSPVLHHFVDGQSLAVNLHGPEFSVVTQVGRGTSALSWLYARTIQNIVPLQDPEGGPLRFGALHGRIATTPDGFLFDEKVPPPKNDDLLQTAACEVEADLLPSKSRRVVDWQRNQERLGMLLWIERRCTVYEALKKQIAEVARSEKITDPQGLLIFDCRGECLTDLYQYCLYQFPSRPWHWSREYWTSSAPYERAVEFEPVDRDGGILAHWVPLANGISSGERRVMDVWLDIWLSEAETVAKTREMLLQLKWRGFDLSAQEDQAALLQQMALAVLLGREMQMPKDSSVEEVDEREFRLAELVLERRRRGQPPPWQEEVDKVGKHESLATLHMDLVNSESFRFTQEALQHPSLRDAVFAFKRFHLRAAREVLCQEDGTPVETEPHSRTTLVSCELPVRHLRIFASWAPPFGFAVPHDALSLPVLERWMPLFASCTAPGAPPGMYTLDAVDRAVGVAAILLAHGLLQGGSVVLSAASLAAWRLVWFALLRLSGAAKQQPVAGIVVLLQVLLCCCLGLCDLAPIALQAEVLDRLCACGVIVAVVAVSWRGWVDLLTSCCRGPGGRAFRVLGIRSDDESGAPAPPFGKFLAVDADSNGGPLPLSVAVPFLGMTMRAQTCRERCVSSDERRAAGCRKRLAVYERPPDPLGFGPSRPLPRLVDLPRFRVDIRDPLPVVLTRSQLAGTEEVRELACTIQVVNHVGCSWSGSRHDSFLSLYKPWGLDNQSMVMTSGGRDNASMTTETERRERYRQSADSLALIKGWRDEVIDWLYGELAASGTVEHTAQDAMLDAGRADRDAFRTEADRRVVPGIFSNDGIGARRYSDSRCFKEGRALHYVILSTELKSSITWRPDPLAAHPADLLCGDCWRPCLLCLQSRSLRYTLRKRDGVDCGGTCPEWKEPVFRDHGDVVEYNVPFFFLDRLAVDIDQGLITLHERDRSLPSMVAAATPEYAPRCLPSVFRVDLQSAHIWDSIGKHYRMSRRPEHIVNYVGQVVEHPLLPGISCRQGPEGEQLWDDGSRYVGMWEAHVYHGQGQLVDTTGSLIYKGEWQWGMKHGEGTYFFQQEGAKRAYNGQWVRDEFRGKGELWVLDESVDEVRRAKPYTILRYQGNFNVSEGQFQRPPNFMKLELEKHASIIKAYFPTRPAPLRQPPSGLALDARPPGSSSLLAGQGPALQFGGEAPRDFAQEHYSLDGADFRHCGPDEACEITYADGTHYEGPCLAAAVPHGAGGSLVEPSGARYEGGFDHGLRAGAGKLTLVSGVSYEGEFAQPGGQRHGEGRTEVPQGSFLRSEVGYCSHQGRYCRGLHEGEGEMVFPDGSIYRGAFFGNRRHGKGCLKEATGSQYDGPWEEDKPGKGKGEILYTSGHRYVGDVSDCQRHGEGKLFHPRTSGDIWMVCYSGQWEKDAMHGKGEMNSADGVYIGRFVCGSRDGTGKFAYAKPEPGSHLLVPPSAKQLGEVSKPRVYEGQWENDQPQGKGVYMDEYGYKNEDASFASGRLSSERRPPVRGCKDKWFNNPKWPAEDKFAPIRVEPSPADWPRSRELCKSRGVLPPVEPLSLRALDVGSGHAHGRVRPAHMGIEGAPGTRWA